VTGEGRVIELPCGCLERTNVGALAGVVEPKPGCPTHGMMRAGSRDELEHRALEAELVARVRELRERLDAKRLIGGGGERPLAITKTKLEECELWLLRALGHV
jgi:hypothetical protein